MRSSDITRYFLKELEVNPVPCENASILSQGESKDWIVTSWDKTRVYIKLLCDSDEVPSEEEVNRLLSLYQCARLATCRDYREMRQVLAPIHAEIDEKSGEKAKREGRRRVQQEKEKREHQAALERKAERQRAAELRHEKQLEKARLYHQMHDEANQSTEAQ